MKHVPFVLIVVIIVSQNAGAIPVGKGPRSGDIFREFSVYPVDEGTAYWRVTNPLAISSGAQRFLPNPVMRFDLFGLDDAIRAEVLIDYWGGHPGTTERAISINDNDWIELPYPETLDDYAYEYAFQINAIVDVPLDYLKNGRNTITGTCSHIDRTSWGQWGWYRISFRIYYDTRHSHTHGFISSPVSGTMLSDNPKISVQIPSEEHIDHIDVFAFYHGYDVDGDGVTKDWHRYYNKRRLQNHVGYIHQKPYDLTWDTGWVPDQDSLSIRAHIIDTNGLTFVTDAVSGLSLKRNDHIIKIYHAYGVHKDFAVRMGEKAVCWIDIPDLLFNAQSALFHLRSWNGANHGERDWAQINDWNFTPPGDDHGYSYDTTLISNEILTRNKNRVCFTSSTAEHGVEILWPGPSISVHYSMDLAAHWTTHSYSGEVPAKIEFNGRSSVCHRDKEIINFSWEFGDGSSATGDTVSHIFFSTGTLPVKLTVTDTEGKTASFTDSVRIHGQQFNLDCALARASRDNDGYGICNSIDNDLTTYWMSVGKDEWIEYDLGASKKLQACYCAFPSGENTRISFSLLFSVDHDHWQTIPRAPLLSSGETTDPEFFNIPDITARWVRLVFHGSSFTPHSLSECSLYGIDVSPSTVEQLSSTQTIELYPNYPNPFNAETKICYDLPQPTRVKFTIYNVRGECQCVLFNQLCAPGKHMIEWNGRDDNGHAVPSGLYFLTIQVDQSIQTLRMMILR